MPLYDELLLARRHPAYEPLRRATVRRRAWSEPPRRRPAVSRERLVLGKRAA